MFKFIIATLFFIQSLAVVQTVVDIVFYIFLLSYISFIVSLNEKKTISEGLLYFFFHLLLLTNSKHIYMI